MIRQRCQQSILATAIRTQRRGFRPSTISRYSGQKSVGQQNEFQDEPDTHKRTDLSDREEREKLLLALNQKSLLDIKIKLNALSANLTTIRTRVPSLIPPTLNAPANEVPPYQLGRPRTILNDLNPKLDVMLKQINHTRAHIEDLQGEDYESKDDGLAKWKEEIEGMGRREREDVLHELKVEEEVVLVRLMERGRRNKALAEGLRERGKAKVVPVGSVRGKKAGKKEKVKAEAKEEGGAKVEVKKEKGTEQDLGDLQKRLNAQMMGMK